MPVDQALRTKGALLFYFSREPKSGLPPGQAHVAISLGDGRTIEAKGRAYGVGEFEAGHRFNYAGIIPEMSAPAPRRLPCLRADGHGCPRGHPPRVPLRHDRHRNPGRPRP